MFYHPVYLETYLTDLVLYNPSSMEQLVETIQATFDDAFIPRIILPKARHEKLSTLERSRTMGTRFETAVALALNVDRP